MKKRAKIKSILLVVLLAILVLAANIWRCRSRVRDVRVDIDYCGADTLVTDFQVAELVKKELPFLFSQMLGEVDLGAVERVADESPYLRDCEAGISIGGSVVVFAVQRRPIVRVCAGGKEYYLDDKGYRVPVSCIGSCDVIVASGNIPGKGKGLNEVWMLASFFDRHPDIAPLFDQIYRDDAGDLFVTPKLGNHVVQVGTVENLEEKFNNLKALYVRGLPKAGWETYKMVSVKYNGQVVCTKRNNN